MVGHSVSQMQAANLTAMRLRDMKLDADDIEQIANRVADLLRSHQSSGAGRYVDAATLADELGVDRDWVYAHAGQLGAIRLGGPRGRLRFDRPQALANLAHEQKPAARKRGRSSRKPTRQSATSLAKLIPYEG
jgi:hypothetical protein